MPEREIVRDRQLGGSYHNIDNFRNVIFSVILELYDYWEGFLFPGEPERLVYASTAYAFKRRIETQKLDPANGTIANSLNVPFFSFAIQPGGISAGVDRTSWKNFPAELNGFMHWGLGRKLRISPMRIEFEATYFSNKTLDTQYIMTKAMWDNALETKIKPKLDIDGTIVENIGLLGYNLSFQNQYTETDFLEQNKLHAVTFDFTIDTFNVLDNTSGFAIPNSVLLGFSNKHGLDLPPDELYTGVIDHIEEEVIW
jgi:hypothetical protein